MKMIVKIVIRVILENMIKMTLMRMMLTRMILMKSIKTTLEITQIILKMIIELRGIYIWSKW